MQVNNSIIFGWIIPLQEGIREEMKKEMKKSLKDKNSLQTSVNISFAPLLGARLYEQGKTKKS